MSTIDSWIIAYWPLIALPLIWILIAHHVALFRNPVKYWHLNTLGWVFLFMTYLIPLSIAARRSMLIGLIGIISYMILANKSEQPGYRSYRDFLTLQKPDKLTYQQPDSNTPQQLWVPSHTYLNPRQEAHLTTAANPWTTVLTEILLIVTFIVVQLSLNW